MSIQRVGYSEALPRKQVASMPSSVSVEYSASALASLCIQQLTQHAHLALIIRFERKAKCRLTRGSVGGLLLVNAHSSTATIAVRLCCSVCTVRICTVPPFRAVEGAPPPLRFLQNFSASSCSCSSLKDMCSARCCVSLTPWRTLRNEDCAALVCTGTAGAEVFGWREGKSQLILPA